MDIRNSPLLKRLILSSGLRLLGMLVAAAIGLVLTPYMLGKLGTNDYGLMVFVGTVVSIIGLMESGLNSAISRHVATSLAQKDGEALNRFFSSGFFLFCGLGILSLGIATLLCLGLEQIVRWSPWIAKKLAADASVGPSLTTFAEILNGPNSLQRNLLLGRIILIIITAQFGVELLLRALIGVVSGALRNEIVSGVSLIMKVVRPVTSLTVLYLGGGVISLTLAGFCLTLSLLPVWSIIARRIVPELHLSPRSVTRETVATLYKFGFFAFASFLAKNLHTSLAIFLITALRGLDEVAVYQAVCVTLCSLGAEAIALLSNFLSPVFAQLGAQKQEDTMRKALFFAIKVSMGAAVFVTFGLIAWGHPFIQRWVCGEHPEWIVTYLPMAILSFTVLFEQSQAPTVEFLFGTATHKYYALVNFIEAAIAVALFPVLIYFYGMIGAALSLVIAGAIARLVLQPHFVCKVLNLKRRTYYAQFVRSLFRGMICCLLPGVVTFLLVQSNYPRLFLVGGLSVAFYVPAYTFLCFTRDERNLVWSALKRKK